MTKDIIAIYHYQGRKGDTQEGYYLNSLIDLEGLINLSERQGPEGTSLGKDGLGPFSEMKLLRDYVFESCLSRDREGVRIISVSEYNTILDQCISVQDLSQQLRNLSKDVGERLENLSKKDKRGIFSKLFQ